MADEPLSIRGKPFVTRVTGLGAPSAVSVWVGRPRASDGWIPGARGTVGRLHLEVDAPLGAVHDGGALFPPCRRLSWPRREWDGISVRINDILVDGRERGRGIGSALLAKAESFAAGLRPAEGPRGPVLVYGLPVPETGSGREMEKLLRFYAANGYSVAGEFVEKILGGA